LSRPKSRRIGRQDCAQALQLEGIAMKKQPRWLKSVIAAASDVTAPLPFARGTRKPIAIRVQVLAKPQARAAG
jgi:hypothetical protein